MKALEVTDLHVVYGNMTAVDGIDIDLYEGEVAALLGANGAGKTSTLDAISGSVPVASGKVVLNGEDITKWPAHKIGRSGMAHSPEGRRIIGALTVEENLLLGAYRNRDRQRITELLANVYEMFPILAQRKDGAGGLLSGGEQQMLAFGRALMQEPTVLLLDEPSMGLAPVIVEQIIEAIGVIAKQGLSILMVEQNASAAFSLASRVYVMEQGTIKLEGPTEEVRNNPLVLEAFLGIRDESVIAEEEEER